MSEHRTESEQPLDPSGTGPWTGALDAVSALVAVLDHEGRIVRVNRPFADSVGCAAEELEGCELWELVEAEQVESIRRMFSPKNQLDRARMVRLQWLTGDDHRRPLLWSFSPLAEGAEGARLALGIGIELDAADLESVLPPRDSTSPETTGDDVEEVWEPKADTDEDVPGEETGGVSVVPLALASVIAPLVEHSSDIICVMSPDGVIEYVSPAVKPVLERDPEEITGTSGLELVHPDDLGDVTPAIERGLASPETPQRVECRLKHADGTWRDVDARGVTYMVNETPSIIVNITDVTERKRTEKALAESEIRFRSAFEFTAIGKVLWSLDGELVRVNRSVCNIFGYKEDELLGLTWHDQIHPEDVDAIASQRRDLLDGNATSAQLDVRVRHHDGPWIWGRATMSLIRDAAGLPQHIIGEIEDITEQRLAEEDKRARLQRVEQQQATIVELATNEAVASGERKEAFHVITEAAAEVLDLERVGVWLLKEDGEELHCMDLFERTPSRHIDGAVFEGRQLPAYFDALEMGRVVDADDARSDPRTEELVEDYLSAHDIRSILDAPIRISGEVVGAVRHEQVGEPRIWQADEIKFAGEVADQVANAMVSTQRKRAERRLQVSEERFRSIVNSSPMGLLMYKLEDDDRLTFTGSNPAADAILGSDCQKHIGKTIEEAFPPLAETEVPGKYREVATSGKPWHIEQIEYEDELIRGAYEVHAFQTAPKTVTVMFVDITDRKRAEEALRKSEERYRLLFERNLAAVYRSALDGRILECNDAFAAIFGCGSRSEALSRSAFDFYQSDDDRKHILEMLRTDGEVKNHELTLKKVSEETVWVLANLSLVNDETGNPTIIEGTMIDISERKTAADRLVLQSTALESAANAIVISDSDGTIEWVNQAFTLLTGYETSDAIGQSLWMLKSGREDDTLYEDIWETINEGLVWRGELVNRRKDGRLYTEDMTITPVQMSDGTISHFIAVQQDVSERKRMEEQLLQAQKMEAVGRLAGGVAHDFNNLLQAMLGVTELLRQPDIDEGDAASKLQELEEHVQRGSQLTRQLLLFSRRDTARQEELDLNQVVQGTVKLLNRLLRENIDLNFDPLDGELPLLADRGQVEQVVMNLAVNACDAMPHGGRLSLVTGLEAGSAWLEVSDTGEGIPEDIRDQLFEPFFTTKEAGKGTGLGLSVVHGIITRLGGRIDLDSDVGEGTSIRVTFPGIAVTGGTSRRVVDREGVTDGEGERVLVVEDDPAVRVSLEEILGVLGYQVTSVGSLEEAIRLPEDPDFDLLLSDYVLPDGTGTDIAEQLRERWPELGVIVMSGYAQDEVVSREAARGSLNFLQKPFSAQVLSQTVSLALAERKTAATQTASD